MGLFRQSQGRAKPRPGDQPPQPAVVPSLTYSWVISGRLAIGPLPRDPSHWEQLQSAGFRSRFSCCYPEEESCAPPDHWLSERVSLPDHRRQEPLLPERLQQALETAERLVESQPATYLHCMAGMERSPLVAAGVVARQRGVHLLEALDVIRLCHPSAMPIYSDLDVLEAVLRNGEQGRLISGRG
jgi:hypothetical protein